MSVDPVQLAQDLTPYATAAVAAYGAAVLARVESGAADATVSFGQRILRRLTGRDTPDTETSAEQQAILGTLADLANAPQDAVRVQIRRILTAHPALAAEIAGWERPAWPVTMTVTTSGERSPAVGNNYGTINTGDSTA
ncbi:hypothetical protein [Streptomyces sp. NPDC048636]|uniref:hypothetical protein n=1 Tax=Streptomyces sp. NPDC048636 TaxID=3155762 RepID=UPI00342DDECB